MWSRLLLVAWFALLPACEGFRPIDMNVDGGAPPDEGLLSDGGADVLASTDGGPSLPCGQLAALPCLDPADAKVIEVPTESSISAAVTAARGGDTIQVRGVSIGSGNLILPPYVTLRGCMGASLDATVRFQGNAGTVEGFLISGAIVANATGSYDVRDNIFNGPTPTVPGVSARSIDGLVSADVTVRVERNAFADRDVGIEVATRYDTMTHSVTLSSINNAFYRVATPISASEAGLVGRITLRVEHNTFASFTTGVSLTSVDAALPQLVANVWANGTTAVYSDGAYGLGPSLAWMVGTLAGGTGSAVTGSFETGDPQLTDPMMRDFHPAAGSVALARTGTPAGVPELDLYRCRRPALRALGAAEQ